MSFYYIMYILRLKFMAFQANYQIENGDDISMA